ncbi:MAG: hypothetical protein ACI86M_002113 [Saprospiraceae bacterium]|jgi:hypothetical protein
MPALGIKLAFGVIGGGATIFIHVIFFLENFKVEKSILQF